MTPERKGIMDIVIYYNDRLGIPEKIHSPLCHFVPDGEEKRIQLNMEGQWDDGKLGWWLGVMKAPTANSVEYQLVKWDSDQGVSGIHLKWLRFS